MESCQVDIVSPSRLNSKAGKNQNQNHPICLFPRRFWKNLKGLHTNTFGVHRWCWDAHKPSRIMNRNSTQLFQLLIVYVASILYPFVHCLTSLVIAKHQTFLPRPRWQRTAQYGSISWCLCSVWTRKPSKRRSFPFSIRTTMNPPCVPISKVSSAPTHHLQKALFATLPVLDSPSNSLPLLPLVQPRQQPPPLPQHRDRPPMQLQGASEEAKRL